MTVDYIYQYALNLIKQNQSGSLDSVRFQRFWNAESSSYFNDLLGRFQKINNGKEGIQTGLIENETILQKLSVFTKPAGITVTAGNANKPSDFAYRLSVRVGDIDAIKINHDQIGNVKGDILGDAPSAANGKYYYVEYLNYFSVLPSSTSAITLDYISYPVDVVWNFTLDGNNRKVYNSTGSVQPVWGDGECREITERMLKKLGVSLKDKDMESFGQSVTQTGN
jgi:hypothetical protein